MILTSQKETFHAQETPFNAFNNVLKIMLIHTSPIVDTGAPLCFAHLFLSKHYPFSTLVIIIKILFFNNLQG